MLPDLKNYARAVAAAAVLAAGMGTGAASPLGNFFNYEGPQYPYPGDCGAIEGQLGSSATWYGEFAGRRYDAFSENYLPFSVQGCFASEGECRFWQARASAYLLQGPMYYTLCRRGR